MNLLFLYTAQYSWLVQLITVSQLTPFALFILFVLSNRMYMESFCRFHQLTNRCTDCLTPCLSPASLQLLASSPGFRE